MELDRSEESSGNRDSSDTKKSEQETEPQSEEDTKVSNQEKSAGKDYLKPVKTAKKIQKFRKPSDHTTSSGVTSSQDMSRISRISRSQATSSSKYTISRESKNLNLLLKEIEPSFQGYKELPDLTKNSGAAQDLSGNPPSSSNTGRTSIAYMGEPKSSHLCMLCGNDLHPVHQQLHAKIEENEFLRSTISKMEKQGAILIKKVKILTHESESSKKENRNLEFVVKELDANLQKFIVENLKLKEGLKQELVKRRTGRRRSEPEAALTKKKKGKKGMVDACKTGAKKSKRMVGKVRNLALDLKSIRRSGGESRRKEELRNSKIEQIDTSKVIKRTTGKLTVEVDCSSKTPAGIAPESPFLKKKGAGYKDTPADVSKSALLKKTRISVDTFGKANGALVSSFDLSEKIQQPQIVSKTPNASANRPGLFRSGNTLIKINGVVMEPPSMKKKNFLTEEELRESHAESVPESGVCLETPRDRDEKSQVSEFADQIPDEDIMERLAEVEEDSELLNEDQELDMGFPEMENLKTKDSHCESEKRVSGADIDANSDCLKPVSSLKDPEFTHSPQTLKQKMIENINPNAFNASEPTPREHKEGQNGAQIPFDQVQTSERLQRGATTTNPKTDSQSTVPLTYSRSKASTTLRETPVNPRQELEDFFTRQSQIESDKKIIERLEELARENKNLRKENRLLKKKIISSSFEQSEMRSKDLLSGTNPSFLTNVFSDDSREGKDGSRKTNDLSQKTFYEENKRKKGNGGKRRFLNFKKKRKGKISNEQVDMEGKESMQRTLLRKRLRKESMTARSRYSDYAGIDEPDTYCQLI